MSMLPSLESTNVWQLLTGKPKYVVFLNEGTDLVSKIELFRTVLEIFLMFNAWELIKHFVFILLSWNPLTWGEGQGCVWLKKESLWTRILFMWIEYFTDITVSFVNIMVSLVFTCSFSVSKYLPLVAGKILLMSFALFLRNPWWLKHRT